MPDNLQTLYNNLVKEGYELPAFDQFKLDMSDPEKSQKLHGNLKTDGYDLPDYEVFLGDMGLKKKDSYLGSLAKNVTPATKALSDFWKEQEPSTTVQPPLLPGKKPRVSYEQTLPKDESLASYFQAGLKKTEYANQRATDLQAQTQKELKEEAATLIDKYKKKAETEGANTDELQNQLDIDLANLVIKKQSEAEKQYSDIYDFSKYKYLNDGDAKQIAKQVQQILQENPGYDNKKSALESLKQDLLSESANLPLQYQEGLKRELNDLIARNSSFDEEGDPTLFAWKKEADVRVRDIESRQQKIKSEFLSKYPDFREVPIVAQGGAVLIGESPSLVSGGDKKKIAAFQDEYAAMKKNLSLMQTAKDRLQRVLGFPDTGKSNIREEFKAVGNDYIMSLGTAGWSDVVQGMEDGSIARKIQKGEPLSEGERAAYDAKSLFDTAYGSLEGGKLGKVIVQGIPFLESMATLNAAGIGSSVLKGTFKQALKKGGTKLASKEGIKLLGSELGKAGLASLKAAPLSPISFTRMQQGLAGQPTMTPSGEWTVDKSTVEGTGEALAKGMATGATEYFTETLGGFMGEDMAVGLARMAKRVGWNSFRMPKAISDIFKLTRTQGVATEVAEELINIPLQLPIGDQTAKEAFSLENIWDTVWTTATFTAMLGSAATPGGVANSVRRTYNKKLVDTYGRETVAKIRDSIITGNKEEFDAVIKPLWDNPATRGSVSGLVSYAKNLATESVARAPEIKETSGEATPTEEFKIGDNTFKSKEELFSWLDKNGGNIGSVNEMGYLDMNVYRALDEWKSMRGVQNKVADYNKVSFIGQQADESGTPVMDMYNVDVNGQQATFSVPVQGTASEVEYNTRVEQKKEATLNKFGGQSDELGGVQQKYFRPLNPSKEAYVGWLIMERGRDEEGFILNEIIKIAEETQDKELLDAIAKKVDLDKLAFGRTKEGDYEERGILKDAYGTLRFSGKAFRAYKDIVNIAEKRISVYKQNIDKERQDAGRKEAENISKPGEVISQQKPEGETVDGIRDNGQAGLAPEQTLATKEDIDAYVGSKLAQSPQEAPRFEKLKAIAGRVLDVLSKISPNTKIVMLENDEVVNKKLAEAGEKAVSFYNGFYNPADGNIYLNAARFKETTPIHEAIHPIMNVMAQVDRAKYDKWVGEASGWEITLEDGTKTTYKQYLEDEGVDKDVSGDEALVTLLEDFVGGNIDYNKVNKTSVVEAVKQMIRSLLEAFGIDPNTLLGADINLDDIEELQQLANAMVQAFNEGRAVTTAGKGNPKVTPANSQGIQFLENGTAADFDVTSGVGGSTQRSITPALKEEVKRGLPQFSRVMPKRGETLVPKSWDIDEDGDNFLFYHYGLIQGPTIEPKFHGKNRYTTDRRTHKVSYYYVKDTQRERMVSGPGHVVAVPKNKVYPFNTDPLGFFEKAKAEWKRENPDLAFGPVQQIDNMNPMIAKAGFDMVVAQWDAFPLRAESTKPMAYDKKKTDEFRGQAEENALESVREAMENDLLKKVNKMGADPALRETFYEKGLEGVLQDENLRKGIDKKLLAKYDKARGRVQPSIDKSITRTPAFKEWFGGSYVIDEDGEPLVVYHGTTKPSISSFKEGMSFFTSSEKAAKRYGAKIYPVYLRIENPSIEDYGGKEDNDLNAFDIPDSIAAGHDGFIARNVDDGYGISDQYVVYSPYQVKSATDNVGTFRKDTPNIQFSIDRAKIIANTKADVDRVKATPLNEDNGATFNLDGTTYTGGGLGVTIASYSPPEGGGKIDLAKLTPKLIGDYVVSQESKIGGELVKPGIYKFKGENKASIDLNIIIPKKYKDVALEFGRLAGHESLFDHDTMLPVPTGATGDNPIQFTDEEFREIAQSLQEGKLPQAVITDRALETGVAAPIDKPTKINKIQPSIERKQVRTREDYKLSFVTEKDLIDMVPLINEIVDKDQRVWFWAGDQLGRGFYYDAVLGGWHFLDAGPSYALDPVNRKKGDIWASGLPLETLGSKIKDSDYIFMVSGSPTVSHAYNRAVFDLVRKRIEKNGPYKKFKKDVLRVSSVTNLTKILTYFDSFDELLNAGKDNEVFDNFVPRKKFLSILSEQAALKTWTPLRHMLFKYDALFNLNNARDDFYKENGFGLGDIMLVLKPTEAIKGSPHSTYWNTIKGSVVGVPQQIVNFSELVPARGDTISRKMKAAVGDTGKVQPIFTPIQFQISGQKKRVVEQKPAPKEPAEREKTLLNRFLNADKLSPAFREHLKEQGTTYEQIPNSLTYEDVDYLIASNSVQESENMVYNTKNDMAPRVRALLGVRVITMLDSFADAAEAEGDAKGGSKYRDRAVALTDWLDETIRDWGRGIQIFASTEISSALAPKSQVIRAKRAIRKQRDTQIEKNKEDIGKKTTSMREANKESVDDLLNSKNIRKIIDDIVAKQKPEKAKPTTQERIKKEQEYRKTQWDAFKKAGRGTMSATIAGLNAEQIEAIGNIVASYVREGIVRTEEIIARLQKEWKEMTGNDLSKEDAKKLLPKEVDGKSLEEWDKEGMVASAEKGVRGALKAMGVKIEDVVRTHYTEYDKTKKTLQDKLVEEAGLEEREAKMLADVIGKAFDKIATEKKKAILQKGVRPKEVINKRKAKMAHERLIELTNMGAFSDAEVAEAYADAWGFPKLTDAQVKEIERLAELVQKAPEGQTKYERTQDLLNYQAKLEGIDLGDVGMGMWYSSILSGFRTQWKNVFANTMNTVFETMVIAVKNPLNLPTAISGLFNGWIKGGYAFTHILRTGYNPMRGFKIEVPTALERYRFRGKYNPLNWFKYVPRFMIAADAFSFGGLKEMRAYEMAMNQARAENRRAEKPTMSISARANEILHHTKERLAEAEVQAEQEGFKKDGTREERNYYKRRVWEIMEQGRTAEMQEDSAHFAAHGTFNYPPEGLIGFATEFIGQMTQWSPIKVKVLSKPVTIKPLKFIIPFTRIIANVANVALDYFPPISIIRATSGSIGTGLENLRISKHAYREYTAEERKAVFAKMTIGLGAMIVTFLLSEPPDDPDEEPVIEISANGYGNYQKNYELAESGWQKYSVRIGKKWYSYQYTPLVLALAPIGYFRDEQKYNKEHFNEKEAWKNMSMAMFKAFSVMGDMTWVTQLTGLLDALQGNTLSEVESYFSRLAQSTAKSVVYPKLAEQTVQIIDYIQENPRRSASTLIGKICKDIPVVRGKYNTMLNAIGDPVMYDPIQMVSEVRPDPFWDYINDHAINIGKPNQKTAVWDDIRKEDRSMNDDEYYNFIKISGQEIKRRIMEDVMPKIMDPEEIKKEINNIKSDVRQQVRVEMFGWGDFRLENPDIWLRLKQNNAIQVPATSRIEWMTDDGKVRATDKEMEQYNKIAMSRYAEMVMEYLGQDAAYDKKEVNVMEGITQYEATLQKLWTRAKEAAKGQIIEEREQKK